MDTRSDVDREEHVRRQHMNGVHTDCDRSTCTHWRAHRLGYVRSPKPDLRSCSVCGGRVRRRPNVACPFGYEDSRYPFLHLHDEDWQDNPHDVVLSELCPLGGVVVDDETIAVYCTLEARHDGPCLYDDTPTAFTVRSSAIERCPLRSIDPGHYYPSTGQCRCFCSVARKRVGENEHTPCRLLVGHDGLCDYGGLS